MFQIINNNNIDHLKTISDNTIDSIITDPPYGIEFLGKDWDKNTGTIECWKECLRVLKPGGHLLAFSSARTYHILATNIQEVGFDIRDQLMWLYASGFPKAQDIGRSIERRKGNTPSHFEYRKQKDNTRAVESHSNGTSPYCPLCKKYTITRCDKCPPEPTNELSGWKTALKPSHEPIVMARKPFKGATIDNVLKHGTGALNIDATRIPFENDKPQGGANGLSRREWGEREAEKFNNQDKEYYTPNTQGRFPSNVIGEVKDYQKYFYCPKVTRRERHTGFEQTEVADPLSNYSQGDVKNHPLWDPSIGTNIQRLKHKILEHNKDLFKNETHNINVMGKTPMCLDCNLTFNGTNDHSKCNPKNKTFVEKRQPTMVGNNHPTVKPVALMRYLIKLVTPANSKVLDPFCGSGSTGMAAVELGHEFIGIELDANYCDIASRRIEGWNKKDNMFDELFDKKAS